MPYENEHSARLKNPKDFEPKSFRRTNGGTIYGSTKVPKTIAIIWAKLKGKSKPKDPVMPQALRFPTKSWTVQKAKDWLKKNKVKYQSFEPATKKEKSSMPENTAPIKACIFNDNAEVTFAESGVDNKGDHFRIVGYSGGIMKNHWFWGNVAFDLKGMSFAKKCTPVLAEHFRDVRIGFTTKQEITGKVIVEGPFLDNDNARQLKTDMRKGFPMEASLLVPALVVEHVKEGASVKVNGHTLKGPGTVFRECSIKEVSMCVFGLDNKTRSTAYADSDSQKIKFNFMKENNTMNGETTITEIESVESFAALYPELHSEVFAAGKTEGIAEGVTEGKNTERALFASLKEACGDDYELLAQCYGEGKTAAEAMQLHIAKLEQEKTQLSDTVTDLREKKKKTNPAVTQFNDGRAEFQQAGAVDESTATDEQLKQNFEQKQELQDEFGDFPAYLAYIKHDVRKK